MKTNVDLRPEHIAKLKEIAAKRGQRGYAVILTEAIESFISAQASHDKNRRELRALKGTISAEEGDEWIAEIKEHRKKWRSSSIRR